MNIVDLSHTIEHGMITYKGLPGPVICDYLSREQSRGRYAPGTEFQIGRIDMVSNTGTYIDAPFHRYAHGKDLAALTLARLVDLDTVVVRADHRRGLAVDVSAFAGREVRGKAVLVHTGWSAHWRTGQYFDNHPFLTAAAAHHLQAAGALLVGIDSHNIDDTTGLERPVHSVLLAQDIPIIEHMTNLAALPDQGARLHAAPLKLRGVGTYPVRAFCVCQDDHR